MWPVLRVRDHTEEGAAAGTGWVWVRGKERASDSAVMMQELPTPTRDE
jgi:hypothetical protein